MSLRHAILGLLTVEPMTGYDLKTKCFDGSIAHFWPADQAQIYRTLEDMVTKGHVIPTPEPRGGGPAKKTYDITPLGKKELDAWLAAGQDVPHVRDATLIQLFFSDRIDDATTRKHLETWKAEYERRLAVYDAIPLPPLGQGDKATQRQRMTLELGLAHAKASIDWAERCLKHI